MESMEQSVKDKKEEERKTGKNKFKNKQKRGIDDSAMDDNNTSNNKKLGNITIKI